MTVASDVDEDDVRLMIGILYVSVNVLDWLCLCFMSMHHVTAASSAETPSQHLPVWGVLADLLCWRQCRLIYSQHGLPVLIIDTTHTRP